MEKKFFDIRHLLFYISCLLLVAFTVTSIVFAGLSSSAKPEYYTANKAVSVYNNEFLFVSDASKILSDDLNGNSATTDIAQITGDENASIVWTEKRGNKYYTVTENKNIYATEGEEVLFRGSVTGIPQSLNVSEDGNAIAVLMRSSRYYSVGFFDLEKNYYNRIELDSQGQNVFIRNTGNGYVIDVVKSDVEFVSYTPEGEKVGRRIIEDIPVSSCETESSVFILAENGVVYEIDLNSYEVKQEVALGGDQRAIGYDKAANRIVTADYTGNISFINADGSVDHADGIKEITGVLVNNAGNFLLKTRTGKIYRTSGAEIVTSAQRELLAIIFMCCAIAFALTSLVLLFLTFARAKQGLKKFCAGVRKHKVPVMILTPVAVLVGFLSYYPAISGLALAFMEYKPGVYSRFIGIQNFVSMMQNEYFWIGFKNLVIFAVAGLIKALIPPIIVALLIIGARSEKMQYFFRTALYIPAILPGVAGLLLWTNGIYGPSGMLNSFVTAFGGTPQNWLGNSDTVIWMLILIGFPWVGSFLIFYGALKGVPSSYHEAARVEGAGYFKILFGIDIPLILPQIRYVLIMALISGVQEFNLVYFTTGGGPGNATYVPMLEIYLQVTKYQNYGVAAAMGVFMFVVLFALTFVNLRLTTKKKEEQL